MVIGSDSPTFALYDDGTVIYAREKATLEEPFHSRMVPDASQKANELLSFDPGKMKERYTLTARTDQPSTVIWTPTKKIVVYGNWRKAPEIAKEAHRSGRRVPEPLPPEISAALLRIEKECSVVGTPWFPAKIEVMFWPYEYAPDESIIWPANWPDLNAEGTKTRGDDQFSVFLASEKLPDLRRFLAKREERGAVSINGKKMATPYRFPFPGEEAWMR
jgi:hypothetical protein